LEQGVWHGVGFISVASVEFLQATNHECVRTAFNRSSNGRFGSTKGATENDSSQGYGIGQQRQKNESLISFVRAGRVSIMPQCAMPTPTHMTFAMHGRGF
jgi:hypothetical protein